MITEDYVSFETAKLLKEKGFDWEGSPFYSEQDKDEWRQSHSYKIPNTNYEPNLPFGSETITLVTPHVSLQMAMKWLREVHNLHISISVGLDSDTEQHYFFAPFVHRFKKSGVDYITPFSDDFDTAEEAAEASIKYCLENLI